MKTSITIALSLLIALPAFASNAFKFDDDGPSEDRHAAKPLSSSDIRKLCYSSSSKKVREVTLIQAGDSGGLGYDFSKTRSLIVDTRVNLITSQGVFQCFMEKSTLSIQKATASSLGLIAIKVSSSERTEGIDLDQRLADLKKSSPYEWSTSSYYASVVRETFAPVYASEKKNISVDLNTYYKIQLEVSDKSIPTVLTAAIKNVEFQDTAYAFFGDAGDHKTPFMTTMTHEGLRKYTKIQWDGSAKICNKISESALEAEMVRGVSLDDLINRHYGRVCP